METVAFISLRTFLAFLFLLGLTRFLGKKQIGQMTYFTYITGIAMGNIAADVAVEKQVSIVTGLTGLVAWTVFTWLLELFSMKSGKARLILDGEPSIVIKNGSIQQKTLKTLRLNVDDLTMMLRNKNIFSVQDVDYAIFEPNGKFSVLKKPSRTMVTKADMQIPVPSNRALPTELITDGSVVKRNLQEVGKTEEWLKEQLRADGIQEIAEVFFAELQSNGTLYIERRMDRE
ncbi:MAG TPA: DUF421 domain-containing protein [Bacillales bacterium]|nr:DUF421 domain-containing protein [Bacillales bacterium]